MQLFLMEEWKLKYLICKKKKDKDKDEKIAKLIKKGKKMLNSDFNLKEII